ncbi:hypothetical protein ACN9MF_01870 [Methylobacterium fujisawaense]|uniref:hypothetical protein n=2 Tax=Methylobacteriaceae TaxID=119045 RepID=UPI003CED61D5
MIHGPRSILQHKLDWIVFLICLLIEPGNTEREFIEKRKHFASKASAARNLAAWESFIKGGNSHGRPAAVSGKRVRGLVNPAASTGSVRPPFGWGRPLPMLPESIGSPMKRLLLAIAALTAAGPALAQGSSYRDPAATGSIISNQPNNTGGADDFTESPGGTGVDAFSSSSAAGGNASRPEVGAPNSSGGSSGSGG